MENKEEMITELSRLRNRHVAKLLSFLGDTPPYLENAIKRAFSMFSDDVLENIINSDNGEDQYGQEETNRHQEAV